MNKKISVIKNYTLLPDVLYLDYSISEEGIDIDSLINKLSNITNKLKLLSIMKKMESSFDSKDYISSIGYAEKIIAVLPNNVNALRGLGMSLFMLKDYSKALEFFNKSLEFSDEKEFEYTYIGWCLCNLNFHQKANAAFEKAIELNPLYEPALEGRTQALIHLHGERLDTVNSLNEKML